MRTRSLISAIALCAVVVGGTIWCGNNSKIDALNVGSSWENTVENNKSWYSEGCTAYKSNIDRRGEPELIVYNDNLYTFYKVDCTNNVIYEYTTLNKSEGMNVGIFEEKATGAHLVVFYGEDYAYYATFNGSNGEMNFERIYDGADKRTRLHNYSIVTASIMDTLP